MKPTTLNTFEYFLNIKKELELGQQAANKRKVLFRDDSVGQSDKILAFNGQTNCPFCTELLKVNDKYQMMVTMEQLLFITE